MAALASVNENVPSAAKAPLVRRVQDEIGVDGSVEAQRRNGLPEGPVPVNAKFPFGNRATAVRRGVSTTRKMVPPPPDPPWVVVP